MLNFSVVFFGSEKCMNFSFKLSEKCDEIPLRCVRKLYWSTDEGQKNVLKFICEVRKMYSCSPERFFIRKNELNFS